MHSLAGGVIKVFAGQRAEQFYVDLGSIFDLANLRPFQSANVFAHSLGLPNQPGVNATNHLNVHSIAIQVPMSGPWGPPRKPADDRGVDQRQPPRRLGARRERRGRRGQRPVAAGLPATGNPLFNEVLVPLGKKDFWNHQPPAHDKQFAAYVAHPELAALLPVIYPAIPPGSAPFANLAALVKSGKPRADLEAILLTGIPPGIVPGFTNFTGSTQADMLRLNTSIPPTPASSPKFSTLGLVGGDPAGFPNGRRITDDVVTIELRGHRAGLTYRALVSPRLHGRRGGQGAHRRPDRRQRHQRAAGAASRTWASPTTATTTRRPDRTSSRPRVPVPGG